MVMLFAKVGSYDFSIVHDNVGGIVGDLFARDQYDRALRKRHHRPHNMFDHDDRDALLVELEQEQNDFVDFGIGQTRHGLVGDEQFGAGGDGARQLEFTQFDLSQSGRRLMGLVAQADVFKNQ